MKTKLIFLTRTSVNEQWTYLPFIPRLNELFNVRDVLQAEQIDEIKKTAGCWSGIHGSIQSVEYRHDDNDFYVEVNLLCED